MDVVAAEGVMQLLPMPERRARMVVVLAKAGSRETLFKTTRVPGNTDASEGRPSVLQPLS